MTTTCAMKGCARPTRSRTAELCNAHYFRQYRTGSTGDPEISDRLPSYCSIDGCSKRRSSREGLCGTHARRLRRNGTTEYVAPARYGEANGSWRGADVGYNAAHDRVRRQRGSAADLSCVDCGDQARHWSYNHRDVDERYTDSGVAYSADPAFYEPRCVACHKRFDLAVLATRSKR